MPNPDAPIVVLRKQRPTDEFGRITLHSGFEVLITWFRQLGM